MATEGVDPISFDTWELVHDDEVGRFDVWFPHKRVIDSEEKVLEKPKDYYSLTAGGVTEILRSGPRPWSTEASGSVRDRLFISSKSSFSDNARTEEISIATAEQFRRFRLMRGKAHRVALVAFIIAALGLIIDASLVIGKTTPTFIVSGGAITVWRVISLVLGLGGLSFVFYVAYTKDT